MLRIQTIPGLLGLIKRERKRGQMSWKPEAEGHTLLKAKSLKGLTSDQQWDLSSIDLHGFATHKNPINWDPSNKSPYGRANSSSAKKEHVD